MGYRPSVLYEVAFLKGVRDGADEPTRAGHFGRLQEARLICVARDQLVRPIDLADRPDTLKAAAGAPIPTRRYVRSTPVRTSQGRPLMPAGEEVSISGLVQTGDGAPVHMIKVTIYRDDREVGHAFTGENGK